MFNIYLYNVWFKWLYNYIVKNYFFMLFVYIVIGVIEKWNIIDLNSCMVCVI